MTEGERWAESELSRLRDAGVRPAGVARFLLASRRRARETRSRRPGLARQCRRWTVAGAVAWIPVVRACRDAGGAMRSGLLWWAGCGLMLDWHLGMVETPAGEPSRLAVADALTLLRAWLVPVVAADGAPAPLVVGALTDLADGAVARRTRTTRLGRDLEGLVDACFVVAALQRLIGDGRIGPWAGRCEQVRIALGTLGLTVVHVGRGRPSRRAREAGRSSAPLRFGALVAAAVGRRRLADRLLEAGTAISLLALAGAAASGPA